MVIKLTYNWIKEYLKTNLTPEIFAEKLSLVGPSFERIEKKEDDFVFEIEITPNRVDVASSYGIAQEAYAALIDEKIKFIDKFQNFNYKAFKEQFENLKQDFEIKILKKGATRYIAFVMENVKVQPSPKFIQKRLQACGIKTINNVVDISNYAMLELGQPNHIFDFEKLENKTLIMREAKRGERIQLLDGNLYKLEEGDLVFVDDKGQLTDLCGIMGGAISSVKKDTTKILVTIPVYNKTKIRKTSLRLNLRTEAAIYFEKGLDEERATKAMKLLYDLLTKYANAKVSSKIFDFYPDPYIPRKIKIKYKDIVRLIGVEIDSSQIKNILSRLGFSIKSVNKEVFEIKVPAHRKNDIFNLEDIVEEVARIYGYYRLPSNLPPFALLPEDEFEKKLFKLQSKSKYFLKARGFNEVMNYSMISHKMVKKTGGDEKSFLRITHPITERLVFMRQELLTSLLENIENNKGFFDEIKIFELAKVYFKKPLKEVWHLAIGLTHDYYYLQALVRILFEELKLPKPEFRPSKNPNFGSRQAQIFINGKKLGILGEIENSIGNFEKVSLCELDFEVLVSLSSYSFKIKPIPKFAVIKLDYNFELSPTLSYEKIESVAFKTSRYLWQIKLLDVYKDKKITLRFFFTDFEKNLTEEQAKKELSKVLKALGINPRL